MKKVLIINTVGFGYEGISTVITNYVKNMNKTNLDIHIIMTNDTDSKIIEDMSNHCTIHILPYRKKETKSYIFALIKLIKNNKFDVVHINGNSSTMFIESVISKIFFVKNVFVHCHNVKCNHKVINFIMKPVMLITSDILLACSKDAGKWLYGDRNFIVLNNAIDLDRYKFKSELREKIRNQYFIKDDDILVGHVGNFDDQKNHAFLIDIFSQFHNDNINSKLLLLGDGCLMETIKHKVTDLGLENSVIFAGSVKNAYEYYSAMDIFLFPSKSEGFGIALLEAQLSGLYCIASNTIPTSTNVSGDVKYTTLNIFEWMKNISYIMNLSNDKRKLKSLNNIKRAREKNYDIKIESEKLLQIYNS